MSTTSHHTRSQAVLKRKLDLHQDIAWTAARCNRLLRTISSRINTLRRLIRTPEPKPQPRKRTVENWSTEDPIWLPNGTKKLKGRTYTAKKKIAEPTKKREEKVMSLAFPSPFVRRMGEGWSPGVGESPLSMRKEKMLKPRRSRQLPIKPSSEIQEVEEGLATALMNLLSQTGSVVQPRKTGARTLFSACLRKVPSYVELEIEANGGQDEAESTTSDVLSYLEEMGSKSGGGWPALAEVIRSHGIHLICDAIEEGLLGDRITDRLASICSARGANPEAQQIFRAFLSSAELPAVEVSVRLDYFCMMDRSQEYKYETLCALGEVDAEIMTGALDVPGFCDALLSRLAVSSTTTAWRFVSNVAVAFRDSEQTSTTTSRHSSYIKSIMARMTAMACTGSLLGTAGARGPALFEAINRLTAETIIASSTSGLSSNNAQLILCSEFLLSLEDHSRELDFVLDIASLSKALGFWSGRAARQAQWRLWRQDFVSEIADAVVALDARLQLGLVEKLLSRVLEVSKAKSLGASLLQEISFAIISGSNSSNSAVEQDTSADFLQQLASISTEGGPPKTPYRKGQGQKFRWEDGLSEWVLATPFIAKTPVACDEDTVSSPEEAACSEPLFDSGYHSSPQVITVCSPDVLALSPPAKRARQPVYSPVVKMRRREAKVEPQASHFRIRKSRRVSDKENEEGSGDELGF